MSMNLYGVEVTPELRAQGERARALIVEASKAWNEFARDAGGTEFDTSATGESLVDAEDEVTTDINQLLG